MFYFTPLRIYAKYFKQVVSIVRILLVLNSDP